MRVYFDICNGYDAADVEYVINQFLDGKVEGWNPNYAPTPPLMSQQLRKLLDDKRRWDDLDTALHNQLEGRRKADEADAQRTPESMARVRALIEETAAKLMSVTAGDDKESKERRRQLLMRANDRPEFVENRESQEYRAQHFTPTKFTAGDEDGRDD